MILIDSNIPMYLVGADEVAKHRARTVVEDALADREVLCTDAEVFQEILHRYTAQRRPEYIEPAFDVLRTLADVVFPIEFADVDRARRLLLTTKGLSARDAIHLAVMQARDVGTIMSFDRAFDGLPGIVRLG